MVAFFDCFLNYFCLSEKEKLPEFWEPQDDETKIEFKLNPKTNQAEYEFVSEKLKNFLAERKVKIENIFRIQNYSMWENYQL